MTTMTPGIPAQRESRVGSLLASNELGLALLIVAFVVVFSIVNPGFTSRFNIYALSRVMGIDMVIGFSMMVVLVTGGLNLAVGSIGVSAVMVGGWLMQVQGVPIALSLPLAIAPQTGFGIGSQARRCSVQRAEA